MLNSFWSDMIVRIFFFFFFCNEIILCLAFLFWESSLAVLFRVAYFFQNFVHILPFFIFFTHTYCRDVELTEKLDYSSAVALIGFSLIVSILRAFNVRDEAARVMVAAPLIAFVTTHILYLNFYKLDYGTYFSENHWCRTEWENRREKRKKRERDEELKRRREDLERWIWENLNTQ